MCVCVDWCVVGLLETLCEHIQHLHNTLSIDALDMSKLAPSGKKKVCHEQIFIVSGAQ